MNGLIGKKLGMTQVFDEHGVHVPVTVIQAGPCVVVQRKTRARDGYEAVQLALQPVKESRVTKALGGHFKKAGVAPHRVLREFRVDEGDTLQAGNPVTVALFKDAPYVDITGISKGAGFQGVVKRHGMGGGRATHGSMSHRRVGAIGMKTWPSRVLKGQRMPGQSGHTRVTTQNLRVVQVREEDNVLLVEGSVPGPNGGLVLVHKALKRPAAAKGKA